MLRIRLSKNVYGAPGILYAVFLAAKVRYFLTSNKHVILEVKNTFNVFKDAKRVLDRKQHIGVLESEGFNRDCPKIWKKADGGLLIPSKIRKYVGYRRIESK